ncbi:MAG: group 1 truncated hemoglobin [Nitrospiraceae bacterium]
MSDRATLYERVGGYNAIHKFAEDILTRLMIDDEIGQFWAHRSQHRILEEHQNFVDWLCAYWGGPKAYKGRDLATVHRGMGITDRHWDILFEKIDQCFDDAVVPTDLRVEITDFLKKFKPVVVGSPSLREMIKAGNPVGFTAGMEAMGVKWPSGRVLSSMPPEGSGT